MFSKPFSTLVSSLFRTTPSVKITAAVFAGLLSQGAQASHQGITIHEGGMQQAVPNEYIVALHDTSFYSLDTFRSVIENAGGDIKHSYHNVLKGFAVTMTKDQLADLAPFADDIKFIEANYIVPRDIPMETPITEDNQPEGVGSWGIDRIDSREYVLDKEYTPINFGEGATVFVLDSGFLMEHKQWGDGSRISEADPTEGPDKGGHGTHVGGTVGGEACCEAEGGWGVAPKAKVVSMQVCGNMACNTDTIVKALDNIAAKEDVKGRSVVNMSVGGPGHSHTLETIVNKMVLEFDIPLIIAGGNGDVDACSYTPAHVPAAITVGASAKRDSLYYRTNFGKCIDIWAPGDFIISGTNSGPTDTKMLSGTSMATPHVAGGAALLLAEKAMGAKELEAALKAKATKGVLPNTKGSVNLMLYVGKDDSK